MDDARKRFSIAALIFASQIGFLIGLGGGWLARDYGGGVATNVTALQQASTLRPPDTRKSDSEKAEEDVVSGLPYVIGEPQLLYGFAQYPVVVSNNTRMPLRYAELSCAFYDNVGALMTTAYTNWTHIAPGDRLDGNIAIALHGRDVPARRDCRSTGNRLLPD